MSSLGLLGHTQQTIGDTRRYSKQEILLSYDAAIEIFEKQVADIRAGITLLKKLREEVVERPDD